MMLLPHIFGDRVISKDIWPSWLPDFALPDYYLWAAIKGTAHRDNPDIPLELKKVIADFIRNIPPTALSRVFANKYLF
jgi:hypothetical protein